MKTPPLGFPSPIRASVALARGLWLSQLVLTLAAAPPASWPQRQRDTENTGRADFTVPSSRLNTNFFNAIRWQKPSPNSPDEGSFGSSAMVFFDGAGPGSADLVAGGYHWPKGIQGMDRHTGALFWTGNPEGGESIGDNTPAFSTNGATIYVISDATDHPLMAFAATNGPGSYWFADTDDGRNKLSAFPPRSLAIAAFSRTRGTTALTRAPITEPLLAVVVGRFSLVRLPQLPGALGGHQPPACRQRWPLRHDQGLGRGERHRALERGRAVADRCRRDD